MVALGRQILAWHPAWKVTKVDGRSIPPEGLTVLDAMIARAEAACERGRRRMELQQGRPGVMRRTHQQRIEETLARLRAQREAATA